MRAQPYFESESSAGFCVGVGCPSFGGQRTDRGGSSRLRTKVVTGLKPQRPAERAGGLALNSRVEAVSRVAVLCEGLCPVRVVALGLPGGENAVQGWPYLKFPIPKVSAPASCPSGKSQSLSPVAASRSGHRLAPPGWPNPFVKGTPRKRAAPYVER